MWPSEVLLKFRAGRSLHDGRAKKDNLSDKNEVV
jgi:hypothetical protein